MNSISISFKRFLSLLWLAAFLLAPISYERQAFAQRRRRAPAASTAAKALTVRTEPNATIWLDEVQRGVTDASGKLTIAKVAAGRHTLRVRASGFGEKAIQLLPAQRGSVVVRLARTTNEAELTFQQAEAAREKARDEESRKAAAALYRRALELRSAFPAAHVGLARVLMDLNDYDKALAEIDAARRTRPVYPEASAVEGRILREAAFTDKAIESFHRAIREGRGFQPEAHTGLARVLEDKGDYEGAIKEFRIAIVQLSESEPALYQLLGAAYEKTQNYKEAVAAYEKYLKLAPEGSLASAIRSIIDQLRRQAAEQETQPD